MADYAPIFHDADEFSVPASAAITGGQVLVISGSNTVAPSSAPSEAWIGVAAFDAIVGQRVTVFTGGVQELTATAAITAGVPVTASANGGVAALGAGTDYAMVIGVAMTTAALGAKVWVKFVG